MRLLSRREGFAQALGILRSKGCVGILFDQNAGDQGALTLLLGRVCSSTELPGVLAAKFGAELRTFYPRRTAFWRVTFETDPVPNDGTAAGATLALNRWLEGALADEGLCASWLWAHDRWRNQDVPERRLRLEAKRNLLAAGPARPRPGRPSAEHAGLDPPAELARGRRDGRAAPSRAARLAPRCGDHPPREARVRPPPRVLGPRRPGPRRCRRRGPGYLGHFAGLRAQPIRTPGSSSRIRLRGDLEARVAGCPQRFGITRPGKPRPFLSDAYPLPAGYDESRHHQLELWEDFLRHFGLEGPLDCSPISGAGAGRGAARSGSSPAPRTTRPSAGRSRHWRSLIESLPSEKFVLFGTAADSPIAERDLRRPGSRPGPKPGGKDDPRRNSRTRLRACRLLVSNDTGGMHLANALGVPLVALFGPTNPIRTGPVFARRYRILQPPGVPADRRGLPRRPAAGDGRLGRSGTCHRPAEAASIRDADAAPDRHRPAHLLPHAARRLPRGRRGELLRRARRDPRDRRRVRLGQVGHLLLDHGARSRSRPAGSRAARAMFDGVDLLRCTPRRPRADPRQARSR